MTAISIAAALIVVVGFAAWRIVCAGKEFDESFDETE